MKKFESIFDYEDRLVRFAGESALFAEKLTKNYAETYYKNQLIRSSGSPVLNYGEAQATLTKKDCIHKLSLVVKELKESRSCLKVLTYLNAGDNQFRQLLLQECEELIAIGFSMIKRKQGLVAGT